MTNRVEVWGRVESYLSDHTLILNRYKREGANRLRFVGKLCGPDSQNKTPVVDDNWLGKMGWEFLDYLDEIEK